MNFIEVNRENYEVDENGHLDNWKLWTEQVANYMAKKDGLELNNDHWKVIDFLINYFKEKGELPMIKDITDELSITTKYLYELYPGGPAMACRYAGLPRPRCKIES